MSDVAGGKPRVFPFACVILAAGAGTRIGQPKATLEIAPGESFLARVAHLALECGADPVIVVVPPGVAAPAGTRAVTNGDARAEQIMSLRLGLAQLTAAPVIGALVWPVDHPAVRLETALALVDAARRTGAPIVVPVHGGRRGHPVWFARDLWRELVTQREGGARVVVQMHASEVHELPVNDAGVLIDVDTPDDLALARGETHALP